MPQSRTSNQTAPLSLGLHFRAFLFLVLIVCAILLWSQLAVILEIAGRAWAVSDPIEAADAAVVLGGGTGTQPHEAAQLYKAGRATRILVSTGNYTGPL